MAWFVPELSVPKNSTMWPRIAGRHMCHDVAERAA